MNPLLHIGWHVDPLEIEFTQLPTPPLSGAEDAEQFVEQVAEVNMPNELQELDPVGVKPTLHVGVQLEPRDIDSVQFPKAPFRGMTDASHAIRIHAPGGPLYMLLEAVYAPVHMAASQSSYPQLVYAASHAVALENISVTRTLHLSCRIVHPVMFCLKAGASLNI